MPLNRLLARKRIRPLLMAATAGLIITQIVALSPSPLEETGTPEAPLEPDQLAHEDDATFATDIPKGRIPDYAIDQFSYVASKESVKQWKLLAEKAFLYNKEKVVHSRKIKAFLYDADGTATIVTGREAKYYTNRRDLEVFGDVHTVFPDGFQLNSPYLRYRPNEKTISIPRQYPVEGDGKESDGQKIHFNSHGMEFAMSHSEIVLPEAVHFVMERQDRPPKDRKKKISDDSKTTIESDHCVIHRDRQIAYFTMYPERPLDRRFVHITQPTMVATSRRAELHYGDFSKMLQYMIAYEDVVIRDTGIKDSQRYGTGGRADFDTQRDVVVLSKYPQVYQDQDTVTGDVIVLHRDTDVVEVENTNAFSAGTRESD